MTAYMEAAWTGWRDYITEGKLAAVLLVSLILLWFCVKRIKQKNFLIYATLTTVLCICPITAAVLELYQTRFYDYPFVWSAVPVTGLIALAFVWLAEEILKGKGKAVVAVSLCIVAGMLFLSSGLGVASAERVDYREESRAAETVIVALENRVDGPIVLWAPKEIMEYARSVDGNVRLLYGRNMWDEHLNAYTYDTYSETYRNMYLWMTRGWDRGELTDSEIAQAVACSDANCILLPGEIEKEIIECFEETLGVKAEHLGDYILFVK